MLTTDTMPADVSPGECPPLVPALLAEHQAEADGHRVVALLNEANEKAIDAGVAVFAALAKYRTYLRALRCFVNVLVKENALTARDGQLLDRSPKLRKLAKIGQYADLLRASGIADRVRGFSGLYQALVLLEELPGTETERATRLSGILDEAAAIGTVSREYLEAQTREARRARKGLENRRPQHVPAHEFSIGAETSDYDLILFTPSTRDVKRLDTDHADECAIEVCRRAYEKCAVAAIAVAVIPLSALRSAYRVLEGFGEPRLFLAEQPNSPEVTNARVVLVAGRGHESAPAFDAIEWDNELDFGSLAELVAPAATTKIHFFANGQHEGWEAVIADANWRVEW